MNGEVVRVERRQKRCKDGRRRWEGVVSWGWREGESGMKMGEGGGGRE